MDLPERILLVEDEALIAFSEKRCLEAVGHIVETVVTGEAAVEAATSTGEAPPFDLVLMDINLGRGMDGGEAASDGRPRQYLARERAYPGRPPHWYETSVGPVLRGGQVMSLILVSRDVTARMEAGVMKDGAAGI